MLGKTKQNKKTTQQPSLNKLYIFSIVLRKICVFDSKKALQSVIISFLCWICLCCLVFLHFTRRFGHDLQPPLGGSLNCNPLRSEFILGIGFCEFHLTNDNFAQMFLNEVLNKIFLFFLKRMCVREQENTTKLRKYLVTRCLEENPLFY